jgi:hypothetical protein
LSNLNPHMIFALLLLSTSTTRFKLVPPNLPLLLLTPCSSYHQHHSPMVLLSILSHKISQMLGFGCPVFAAADRWNKIYPWDFSPPQVFDHFLLGQTAMAVKHARKWCAEHFPLPDNPSTWLTVSTTIASLTFSILHVDPHPARISDIFHCLTQVQGSNGDRSGCVSTSIVARSTTRSQTTSPSQVSIRQGAMSSCLEFSVLAQQPLKYPKEASDPSEIVIEHESLIRQVLLLGSCPGSKVETTTTVPIAGKSPQDCERVDSRP